MLVFLDRRRVPRAGRRHRPVDRPATGAAGDPAGHVEGGAGVAGSAIVVLASTLAATGTIPVASVGLILGVHRLLSSAFVPVNVLGNAIATLVIARMEQALDVPTFESELRRPAGADVAVDVVEMEPGRQDGRPTPVAS